MPGAQAMAPAPGDTMGAQGGIATLMLLLLACHPQPLCAGPLVGGKPPPTSPPKGWSSEKRGGGGEMFGFGCTGWASCPSPRCRRACCKASRSEERQLPVFGQGV